jgi:hypothetical protein
MMLTTDWHGNIQRINENDGSGDEVFMWSHTRPRNGVQESVKGGIASSNALLCSYAGTFGVLLVMDAQTARR